MTVTLDSGWSLPSNVFIGGGNDKIAGFMQFCKGLICEGIFHFVGKVDDRYQTEDYAFVFCWPITL